jgi:hypothetical protein
MELAYQFSIGIHHNTKAVRCAKFPTWSMTRARSVAEFLHPTNAPPHDFQLDFQRSQEDLTHNQPSQNTCNPNPIPVQFQYARMSE